MGSAVRGSSCTAGFSRLLVRDSEGGRAAIRTALWYPAVARESEISDGGFVFQVARDASPVPGAHPLVLLSHGSGGWYGSHHLLAEALARRGYVVAAPTHPGDNLEDLSGFGGEGQLLGRPRHLGRVHEDLFRVHKYAAVLDRDRVAVIGHSAGAYAALVAMGARPDFSRFADYFATHPGAPGFLPHWEGMVARLPASPRWSRVPGIGAAVLMAPALGFLFSDATLGEIGVPTRVYAAADDAVAPVTDNAAVLRAGLGANCEFQQVSGFGHHAFVAPANATVTRSLPEVFRDPPGADRRALHQRLVGVVAAFLDARLGRAATPGGGGVGDIGR